MNPLSIAALDVVKRDLAAQAENASVSNLICADVTGRRSAWRRFLPRALLVPIAATLLLS